MPNRDNNSQSNISVKVRDKNRPTHPSYKKRWKPNLSPISEEDNTEHHLIGDLAKKLRKESALQEEREAQREVDQKELEAIEAREVLEKLKKAHLNDVLSFIEHAKPFETINSETLKNETKLFNTAIKDLDSVIKDMAVSPLPFKTTRVVPIQLASFQVPQNIP